MSISKQAWPWLRHDLSITMDRVIKEVLNEPKNQKKLQAYYEEECTVESPLSFWHYHGGVGSTYIIICPFGSVVCELGDKDFIVRVTNRKEVLEILRRYV
jgi:hypothetical protein